MAVTVGGRTVQLTATTDAFTGLADIAAITFRGTGLTAGQAVRLLDSNDALIAEYLVEATAVDNADLWGGRPPSLHKGFKLDGGTLAGTWVLTVTLN